MLRVVVNPSRLACARDRNIEGTRTNGCVSFSVCGEPFGKTSEQACRTKCALLFVLAIYHTSRLLFPASRWDKVVPATLSLTSIAAEPKWLT